MTDLDRLSRENHLLNNLIDQARRWQRTEPRLLAVLPPNLQQRCRAVRIRDDGTLVLHAADNLAASRLRMIAQALVPKLQSIDSAIQSVHVKIRPPETVAEKTKQARLSPAAAGHCLAAAERLSQQHPDLAEALRTLAAKADHNRPPEH